MTPLGFSRTKRRFDTCANASSHDSATKHVQGAAPYIDDIPEPSGTLHVATGGAAVARGRITSISWTR